MVVLRSLLLWVMLIRPEFLKTLGLESGERNRLLDLLKPVSVSDSNDKQFDIVVPFDWLNSARDMTLHFGKFFPSSKFVVHEGGEVKQDSGTGAIDNSLYMNGGTNRFDKYRFHAGLGKRSSPLIKNIFRHGLIRKSASAPPAYNIQTSSSMSDSIHGTNAIGDMLHEPSDYNSDFDTISRYIWRTMPYAARKVHQNK
ncbi:hypothetical protein ScPMuIL_007722 [Solemya velum]